MVGPWSYGICSTLPPSQTPINCFLPNNESGIPVKVDLDSKKKLKIQI